MTARAFLLFWLCIASMAPSRADAAPIAWAPSPAGIAADCTAAVARLATRRAAIDSRGTVAAPALESAVADARDAIAGDLFAAYVVADEPMRDASQACRLQWRNALVDTRADRRLYASIGAATTVAKNPFDRALAQAWQRRMLRGGAALDGARHDRYVALAHELDELENRFWTEVANDRTTVRIDRREVRGVPPALLAAFERNRDGTYTVPVDDGTLDFLRYAADPDAREAYRRAYDRRAAAAGIPLLRRAIAVRDRMAHALGYESWADYRLASEQIFDLQQAQAFLRNAAAAYTPAHPSQNLPSAPRTIDSALDEVGAAAGIRFSRAGSAAWSKDVLAYALTDAASGRDLGTLYLDLFRRPGKQTQETVQTILPPRAARPAAVAIVASWTATRDETLPADRTAAFFGDAGRAMSSLLAEVPYESLDAGRAAREFDAAFFERLADGAASTDIAADMPSWIAAAQTDLTYHASGSHVVPQVTWLDLMDGWDGLLWIRPWSRAYAADVFAALAPQGSLDERAGERYRRAVLAPAGSRSLTTELRDLLGRDPKAVMP